MSDNPFYRLAPFIQEYIYRKRWDALRSVQVQSIYAILDSPNHVLITSGTASGKTEAAMLPILTKLHQEPSATIGVLYIGPLKALINDQFERLQGLLEESNMPVQSWHGDIEQSKKTKFLRQAQGVLQITPESLEAMLINRQSELKRLFGDLRFVVIDEIHAFIGTDRGRQVMCQLQRLARYQSIPARRIGLSATIGEPQIAMKWLAGGTSFDTLLISDTSSKRDVRLGLEYFLTPIEDSDAVGMPESESEIENLGLAELPPNPVGAATENVNKVEILIDLVGNQEVLYHHIFNLTQQAQKSLVFANSRNDAERVIANMRRLVSETPGQVDFYYVHHGSISTSLRELAEMAMRDPERKACTAATVTLELGIDIGHLDQVLQINATHSVSSFVQRLGRSGRRGGPAHMFFYCQEDVQPANTKLGKLIPWNFLQTIAIIQLYLEEKWVEPPQIPLLPFNLLYHQTMSVLTANTELTPSELAERILTLSPFSGITIDYFRELLQYLIEIKHLEVTEIGSLIVGLEAEKIVNNYRFYATFEDEIAYHVRRKSRDIGVIQVVPEIGDTFSLAGYSWRVLSVDSEKRIIQVEPVHGKAKSVWMGGGGELHSRILQRMRQILREDVNYPYLQERALKRLWAARQIARDADMSEYQVLELADGRYMVTPWCGTRIVTTQIMLLSNAGIHITDDHTPFYFEITDHENNRQSVIKKIKSIASTAIDVNSLIAKLPKQGLQRNKYDRYIPETLLREAFLRDYLDFNGAIEGLNSLI